MSEREKFEAWRKSAGLQNMGASHSLYALHAWQAAKTDSAAEIAALRTELEEARKDADAFRLMARLNINVNYRENINGAWVVAEHEDIEFCPESLDGPHEYDATRLAITRAAAAIDAAKELGK